MAPLNASSVFLLWAVVALLGASTAAPPSGRPSRGDRTVPPPDALHNRSADVADREDEAGSTHLRRERAMADGAVADAVAPGAGGAGTDGPEARKAFDSGIVSRRKSKSSHSRRSENRERTSPAPQTGKQQSGDGQVDYYYFDSFEEGVTGSADFDDLREGGRREEDEPEDDDGASVMELLTMASWHKSQKTA